MVETATDAIVSADQDDRIILWNSGAERIFGYTKGEVIGAPLIGLIIPEEYASVMKDLVDSAGTGAVSSLSRSTAEVEAKRKEGRLLPVEVSAFSRRLPTGSVYTCILRDITERKQAEEALRESESRYHSLFSSMSEGFALHHVILDDAGKPCDYRFLDINPAFERLTGMSREAVVGKSMREVLPQEDPYWIEIYGRVALTGESVHFEHYSPVLKKHYEVFAYRPAPLQFAVVFTDVSERKRTEEALRESRNRLSVIMESIADGFYALDQELRFTHVNDEALHYFKKSREEMLGRTIFEVFPGFRGSLFHSEFEKAMERGKAARVEAPSAIMDRIIEAHIYPAAENMAILFRDVTERKRTEEALRESEAKYRNLFENITEEVHFWKLVRDDNGRIINWRLVDANPPTLVTWGKSLEEIKGKTTDEIFGPGASEHYMPVVMKIMTEGVPFSFADYFPNLDRYFQFTSIPLGDYFITTGFDITSHQKGADAGGAKAGSARGSQQRTRGLQLFRLARPQGAPSGDRRFFL